MQHRADGDADEHEEDDNDENNLFRVHCSFLEGRDGAGRGAFGKPSWQFRSRYAAGVNVVPRNGVGRAQIRFGRAGVIDPGDASMIAVGVGLDT
jgi:hypothetical protein